MAARRHIAVNFLYRWRHFKAAELHAGRGGGFRGPRRNLAHVPGVAFRCRPSPRTRFPRRRERGDGDLSTPRECLCFASAAASGLMGRVVTDLVLIVGVCLSQKDANGLTHS